MDCSHSHHQVHSIQPLPLPPLFSSKKGAVLTLKSNRVLLLFCTFACIMPSSLSFFGCFFICFYFCFFLSFCGFFFLSFFLSFFPLFLFFFEVQQQQPSLRLPPTQQPRNNCRGRAIRHSDNTSKKRSRLSTSSNKNDGHRKKNAHTNRIRESAKQHSPPPTTSTPAVAQSKKKKKTRCALRNARDKRAKWRAKNAEQSSKNQ